MDGFSKFKRHMFKIDRSDDRKMLSLKIYFRFRREKAFFLISLKIGDKTMFLKIFPFRIERVTTSSHYIEEKTGAYILTIYFRFEQKN